MFTSAWIMTIILFWGLMAFMAGVFITAMAKFISEIIKEKKEERKLRIEEKGN